ncbi:MAG: CHASE2 domain-containing protein [Moorea sp. SIOASIH]|nr:CHASE2 domain-containing protein [Moorena sp. SIOASIH]
MTTVFEIKIWYKTDDNSCFFLLLWDDRRRQLSASLNYCKEIQRCYQRWRQRYTRFYEFPSVKPIGDSGRINPGSGDRCYDLMEAEREFLNAFQRWLGEGNVRKIQQRIRDELTRVAQVISEDGKGIGTHPSVDIFVACDSIEMERLPWETWELAPEGTPLGRVRIFRSAMDNPDPIACTKPLTACGATPRFFKALGNAHRRKTRILAIFGDDPRLPLQDDWKAVRSLKSIAEVERVTWQPHENHIDIKTKIANAICDQRGWDVLFFAGHSDETTTTGGRLAIAPNISLSISELEEKLTQAREHRLQLAIFNSCSGLSIANSLIKLGLQVIVMREPIRNDVAQSFLQQFCKPLADHRDVYDALLEACQHLQSVEKFAYPSAYLLPSLFNPPGLIPYRIERFDWKKMLQQWLPTRPEAIALGTVLLLSVIPAIQVELLFDIRAFVQAVYRNLTNQLPKHTLAPVLLVAIDQESLDQADEAIESTQGKLIDSEYLAKLVRHLYALNAQVIGIYYSRHIYQPRYENLDQAIRSAVEKQNTWFVLATDKQDKVASRKWSLEGYIEFEPWTIEQPLDPTCIDESCPFAYQLAVAHLLNHQSSSDSLPQPTLNSTVDFQSQVSDYLKPGKTHNQGLIPFNQSAHPFGLASIIDFSIPPRQVYKSITAKELLNFPVPNPELQQHVMQQVVIITHGDYNDTEDDFYFPSVAGYWCHYYQPVEQDLKQCLEVLTRGEVFAYMVHHIIRQHRVVLIPDHWVILLGAFLGKWTTIILVKKTLLQRHEQVLTLGSITGIYGLFVLQVYISALVLIPWFLPSILVWFYYSFALQKYSLR